MPYYTSIKESLPLHTEASRDEKNGTNSAVHPTWISFYVAIVVYQQSLNLSCLFLSLYVLQIIGLSCLMKKIINGNAREGGGGGGQLSLEKGIDCSPTAAELWLS